MCSFLPVIEYFSSGYSVNKDGFSTLVPHILPYVALLSLDGINAYLPNVALLFPRLQHTHHTLMPYSNHHAYCI